MVSAAIQRELPALTLIVNSGDKVGKKILKSAQSRLVRAIRDCINLILNGDYLDKHSISNLAPYKERIRKIASRKTKAGDAKKLVQSGSSFLLPLLTAAVPAIINTIGGWFKKK